MKTPPPCHPVTPPRRNHSTTAARVATCLLSSPSVSGQPVKQKNSSNEHINKVHCAVNCVERASCQGDGRCISLACDALLEVQICGNLLVRQYLRTVKSSEVSMFNTMRTMERHGCEFWRGRGRGLCEHTLVVIIIFRIRLSLGGLTCSSAGWPSNCTANSRFPVYSSGSGGGGAEIASAGIPSPSTGVGDPPAACSSSAKVLPGY